jgi:hypothetical protein
MEARMNYFFVALALDAVLSATAIASVDTIGPNGINSAGLTTANGLPLNGGPVGTVSAVAISMPISNRLIGV